MNSAGRPESHPSRRIDRPGDAVSRSRRGLHAPIQVIGVSPDEMNPPVGLDDAGPDFRELPGRVMDRLAGRRPGIVGPLLDQGLFDIL